MLENIEKINQIFTDLATGIRDVETVSNFRKSYMEDPAAAIRSVSSNSKLLAPVLKYQDIFINSVNISIAKDDALDDINDILLNSVSILETKETELYAALNSILAKHSELSNNIVKSSIMEIAGERIKKLFSGAAFIELGSKQLNKFASPIMSELGVNTESVKDWLYGIYTELSEINFDPSVNKSINYTDVDSYVSVDMESFKGKTLDLEITKLEPAKLVNPNGSGLESLANYVEVPKYEMSALDVLAMLYKLIIELTKGLKLHTYVHTMPDVNSISKYKKLLTEASKDGTSIELTEVNDVMKLYKTHVTRLSITTEEIVNTQTALYNDLMLVASAQLLLGKLTNVAN